MWNKYENNNSKSKKKKRKINFFYFPAIYDVIFQLVKSLFQAIEFGSVQWKLHPYIFEATVEATLFRFLSPTDQVNTFTDDVASNWGRNDWKHFSRTDHGSIDWNHILTAISLNC